MYGNLNQAMRHYGQSQTELPLFFGQLMNTFKNKKALVTGASIESVNRKAIDLEKKGAELILTARSQEQLESWQMQ